MLSINLANKSHSSSKFVYLPLKIDRCICEESKWKQQDKGRVKLDCEDMQKSKMNHILQG